MATNKSHSAQQAAALRLEIYQRYCSGQTQASIAAALGMRQSNVCYHISKARAAHQAEIEHRRADRLAELDRVRNEAWSAWEQDRTAQATAFLGQIQKAIQQERHLLGLDTPRTVTASLSISELPNDTEDLIVGGLQES